VDCIHFEEGPDRMLYINPVECIDCGACQPACPVNAIFPEADVPADQRAFIQINELWYSDAAQARGNLEAAAGAAPAGGATAPTPAAPAVADAPTAPAAAAAAAALAPEPEPEPEADMGLYKLGEAGIEGKCALCGQYVIKGGVTFRTKSVVCPDCAKRAEHIRNPYAQTPGRR
jgi:ferredoxin